MHIQLFFTVLHILKSLSAVAAVLNSLKMKLFNVRFIISDIQLMQRVLQVRGINCEIVSLNFQKCQTSCT
jgi:hypothetical protein